MKYCQEIRNVIYLVPLSLLIISCSPKYGAHFQSSNSSNYSYKTASEPSKSDQASFKNIQIQEENWSNASASIDDKAIESPIMQIVKEHSEKVKSIELGNFPQKETSKEIKASKKDFRKKLKVEVKREVKRAKEAGDGDYALMMVLGILIAPLGVGLTYDIGTEFWISLILFLLFWLPGAIYGGIKVHQFYKG